MVYQTHTVEVEESEEGPLRSVARNTSEFAEDVLTLAELQARLLTLETKEWALSHSRLVMLATAAVAVGIGLVPMAFLTFAAALNEVTTLSHAQSLGLALVLGIALNGGLLLGIFLEFKKKKSSFTRSSREWDANFRWIRNMLRRQGRRW